MRPDPSIALVAAAIRDARVAAGLSQSELARRTGLDLRTITRVESIEREPSISTLVRIARGIGISVSELLRDIE